MPRRTFLQQPGAVAAGAFRAPELLAGTRVAPAGANHRGDDVRLRKQIFHPDGQGPCRQATVVRIGEVTTLKPQVNRT